MTTQRRAASTAIACAITIVAACCICACAPAVGTQTSDSDEGPSEVLTTSDIASPEGSAGKPTSSSLSSSSEAESSATIASADALRARLSLTEDYRPSFVHGEKGAAFQKYIVLHDTEGDSSPESVVDYWDGNGNLVAAHFVVGKDGSVVQCVPLDTIAHHAGFGDAGHNTLYGVEDESRDDKLGTTPIGDWVPDYGMNSYSVGIEMVHIGGEGDYPEEQLAAVDALIAYIDAYYGFDSTIIDHKAWRTGNSDTSPEFATYLTNYQTHRTHSQMPNRTV